MKKICFIIFAYSLWLAFLHFYKNASKKLFFNTISALSCVKTMTLEESDEIFEISYDIIVTLKNEDIVKLHRIKSNLDIENAILKSINDVEFICKRKDSNENGYFLSGIPFDCMQSYFNTEFHTVTQFLDDYYKLREVILSLPYSDFSTDLNFHRGKEGWGIDKKKKEYFIGRYSSELYYLTIPNF